MLRATLIFGYMILMTLMLPRSFQLRYPHETGQIWKGETLLAPFEFAIIKSEDSLEAEKNRWLAELPDVYIEDTAQATRMQELLLGKIAEFYAKVTEYQAIVSSGDTARARQVWASNSLKGADPRAIQPAPAMRQRVEAEAKRLLSDIYRQNYIEFHNSQPTEFVSLRKTPGREVMLPANRFLQGREGLIQYLRNPQSGLPPAEWGFLKEVIVTGLSPNIIFSQSLTDESRRLLSSQISLYGEKIGVNEKIIGKDEVVDARTSLVIDSLMIEEEKRFGGSRQMQTLLGQFLIVVLITSVLLSYLSVNRPRIYFDNSRLSLILVVILMAVGLMVMATKLTPLAARLSQILGPNINLSYIYLAPACIVAIFISNFFEHRTAFMCNLLTAMYGAVLVQQGLEYVFVQTIAGTVVVFSLRRLRKRDTIFYTLGYVLVAYIISYVSFHLLGKGSFAAISYHTLLLFGINVLLTLLAYNLIYVFERVFGTTSDLTFLELLDTNHPLMQDLARKAPGTFQHSLHVAALAEAAINEISGNALLTHVGAMYHDIGKTYHHKYFIENMSEEERQANPHGNLDCTESAEIIIGHVKKGVDLAHKYRLPQEIIQFIETHHGTTRVEYFYRQYLKENKCDEPTDEGRFRYPGPIPFSKEMAVVMIADSVEAASRAMKSPTPEKLREMVDAIVDHKIKDSQLENSSLTFKDISVVRKSLYRQLLTMNHSRIEYPKAPITV